MISFLWLRKGKGFQLISKCFKENYKYVFSSRHEAAVVVIREPVPVDDRGAWELKHT